ncbi:aminopeptidase N [Allopusillimonas soli]|uniref:Aminopeptidase N n=1 Tax=Allopusillimonas soli TaxID=659016 RepID=A0A853FB15_9BURK|nr:aminopeptidase N [Allopusillimonas soli]NYT37119.1 aminopeptidase N [Allopusillimonas soli]TEA75550.1 aminopeptidase N [Allopusillimonas soli]
MRTESSPTISRNDYQPYPYALPRVELTFDLDPACTRVYSRLHLERQSESPEPLVLNGEELALESVSLDGRRLAVSDYRLEDGRLTLFPEAARFVIELVSTCRPQENSTLMGLYVSGDHLFTQCEAEGFRRITWFPDRPDVMARYTVRLRADRARYPLLLSNGNLASNDELPDGRHEAVWEDPHPKPCYLFALVAGSFDCREQSLDKDGGGQALLQVYSDRGSNSKTAWALACLEHAVRWDERRFGLKLDLDRFMIVAARDFNMGAMENKGLNIFNSAYVLADKDTATDAAYRAIEAVIGHEYFHNWTGNRVTCRDWFQLSLKEGLTVFRDQEFSADMLAQGLTGTEARSARAVKRIDDVSTLRIAQFPEDAGPMAHPIRPESYQEIGNFYTATVYEKGAEVIRMQHTLLGEAGFQAGMAEYFRRHDGQAVTCDDFVSAMESVYTRLHPGKTLAVFRRWYSQAGTPRVTVEVSWDPAQQACNITLTQRNAPAGIEKLQDPPTAKPPLHIPFAIGLLTREGKPITLHHEGRQSDTALLELTEASHTWTFTGIPESPVVSLLRNFSAPVIVEYERPDTDLALLARHDADPFARWEAGQALASRQLLAMMKTGEAPSALFIDTWQALLLDADITDAYRARVLALPSDRELLEKTTPMDPLAAVRACRHLQSALGNRLTPYWMDVYRKTAADAQADYSPDPASAGRRALKNLALSYLMAAGHPDAAELARMQYDVASNMTDRMGALSCMLRYGASGVAIQVLDHFYQQWQHDPLVMDKWFALQATAPDATVETVRSLMLHPAFSLRNPNRARSVVFQFCMNNLQGIHGPGGYDYWAEQVLALDSLNPEIAARLARAFDSWSRYADAPREGMRAALEHVRGHAGLSRNVSEIVNKALKI